MKPCEGVSKHIVESIAGSFRIIEIGGDCFITTPFLFPDNTPISIRVETNDDGSVDVSDDGQAADYAFLHGVSNGAVRKRLAFVASRFGMDVEGGVMSKRTETMDAADAAISIILGAQDVAYLVYKTTRHRARETFSFEVEAFLASQGRTYSKNPRIPGKTGTRSFDYLVRGDYKQLALSLFEPGSQQAAVTRAKRLAFDFMDVRNSVAANLDFGVLIDTRNGGPPSDEVVSILNAYAPHVIQWDSRHELQDVLLAA